MGDSIAISVLCLSYVTSVVATMIIKLTISMDGPNLIHLCGSLVVDQAKSFLLILVYVLGHDDLPV